jgi:hypothetical protein
MIVLQMEDKREAAPSAMKPPKEFRQTVKIGSASSWDKDILSLFHVSFDRMTSSDLAHFLNPQYFRPPEADDDCYRG